MACATAAVVAALLSEVQRLRSRRQGEDQHRVAESSVSAQGVSARPLCQQSFEEGAFQNFSLGWFSPKFSVFVCPFPLDFVRKLILGASEFEAFNRSGRFPTCKSL